MNMKTITIRRIDDTIIASREAKNMADLVEQLVREKVSLAYAELSKVNLTNTKLAGANLRGASLGRSNLRFSDLAGANLAGAILWGADFTETNLQDANFAGAYLWRVGLGGADLAGANLTGADLWYANLEYANFTNANLSDADLDGANLEGAYLANANLKDATLNWESHALLSELLWRAADTPEREQFAAWVGRKLGWCWDKFLDCGHDEIDWALNALASHGDLDGAPDCVIAAKRQSDERLKTLNHPRKDETMTSTIETGTDGGVIKDKDMTVCFVNTDTPAKRKKYVGFFVSKQQPKTLSGVYRYVLCRLDRVFYPHPSAPSELEISALETTVVKSVKETDPEVSSLILLYHAQETAKQLVSDKKLEDSIEKDY